MIYRACCGLAVALLPLFAAADAPATAPSANLGALREWLARPRGDRAGLASQPFAAAPLTRTEAEQARRLLWDDHTAEVREARAKEWAAEAIAIGDKVLRFKSRRFGTKPKDGWNLFISLHGGGGAPAAVNDQQWENQVKLYQPADSLYVAPRAPTDHWNLWHEPHVDALLDRFLADAYVLADVNPNRAYVMGYSAGGDGVYQLAPRMADRWAAASMMAGHPNDASPLGLRNVGFAIHVGALDNGYDRNKVALDWKRKLDDLARDDPPGYAHEVQLHEGRGHWMNLEDRVAVDWMARFTREPLPTKVVWKQSAVTHDRFYWLARPPGEVGGGQLVVASRRGQRIEVESAEGVATLTVLLSDAMADLDKPLTIAAGGRVLFEGTVRRSVATLVATLAERGDPFLMFDAAVTVRP